MASNARTVELEVSVTSPTSASRWRLAHGTRRGPHLLRTERTGASGAERSDDATGGESEVVGVGGDVDARGLRLEQRVQLRGGHRGDSAEAGHLVPVADDLGRGIPALVDEVAD